jgi:hypothetical protein
MKRQTESHGRARRTCHAAIGWIPLALALSAMAPVPSCFETPEQAQLRQLYFQKKMNWNAETALQLRGQIQLIQPYRYEYPLDSPAVSRRGDVDLRLRSLPIIP